MSTTTYKHSYRCWNDCEPQGCPGHEASLEYQSVSETCCFDNGKGSEITLQPPEVEAFMGMLLRLPRTFDFGDVGQRATNG